MDWMRVWAGVAAVVVVSMVAGCGDDGGGGGTRFDAEDLRRAQVKLSACAGQSFTEFDAIFLIVALNVDLALIPGAEEELRCLDAAETCDAVYACAGIDPSRTCDPETFTDACADGQTLETCSGGFVVPESCPDDPSGNVMCVEPSDFPMCASGSCEEDDLRCEGDVVVDCFDGVETRQDCRVFGLACGLVEGNAECVPVPDGCAADRCEGNVLLDCADGGTTRIDCAGLSDGTVCDPDAARGAACASRPGTCTEDGIRCVGDVIRVCDGGAAVDFDCGAFLDATCVLDTEGFFDEARCVLPM